MICVLLYEPPQKEYLGILLYELPQKEYLGFLL